ncbi:hypothetical protein PR048_031900 [Dryococelus australis]|uniref:Uncharacterized protein n=1 Tax=Dryococelus australis TaxID=614101 RepID=A0ABQ9G987_9NEOP|nr:hypothetical protein PR048_031900 [Dryococelus australis]
MNSSTKVKANLASLPLPKVKPSNTLSECIYRHNNGLTMTLNPEHGGRVLSPIKTMDPIVPDTTLNSIFCSCATGCGGSCGCWKAGIHCSSYLWMRWSLYEQCTNTRGRLGRR